MSARHHAPHRRCRARLLLPAAGAGSCRPWLACSAPDGTCKQRVSPSDGHSSCRTRALPSTYYGLNSSVAAWQRDRQLVRREHAVRLYGMLPYALARGLTWAPLVAVRTILFSVCELARLRRALACRRC